MGLGGGVYKSVDGGAQWTRSGLGLDKPFLYSLAINPQVPSILYVGTGNVVPGLPISNGTVYKSTDGGKSWNPSGNGLLDAQVNALVVNPANPNTVYAGTDKGLFKSTNSGQSWTGVHGGAIASIAIPENAPTTLYVGTYALLGGTSAGVFKSIDEGANWDPPAPD